MNCSKYPSACQTHFDFKSVCAAACECVAAFHSSLMTLSSDRLKHSGFTLQLRLQLVSSDFRSRASAGSEGMRQFEAAANPFVWLQPCFFIDGWDSAHAHCRHTRGRKKGAHACSTEVVSRPRFCAYGLCKRISFTARAASVQVLPRHLLSVGSTNGRPGRELRPPRWVAVHRKPAIVCRQRWVCWRRWDRRLSPWWHVSVSVAAFLAEHRKVVLLHGGGRTGPGGCGSRTCGRMRGTTATAKHCVYNHEHADEHRRDDNATNEVRPHGLPKRHTFHGRRRWWCLEACMRLFRRRWREPCLRRGGGGGACPRLLRSASGFLFPLPRLHFPAHCLACDVLCIQLAVNVWDL